MIGNYTLAMLCEKYGIDATKIVKKNNNVLDLGEYSRIDYVLDYLVNEFSCSQPSLSCRRYGRHQHLFEMLHR